MKDERLFLEQYVRAVQDWPTPGVVFRDITPLLSNAQAFALAIDLLAARHRLASPGVIAAVDARGFIFGGALAHALGCGFVPIRKAGKLPWATFSEAYSLEYGHATLEIHQDAIAKGERVVLVDDLLATGGTLLAAQKLLNNLGAEVLEINALIDLPELGGSDKLRAAGVPVFALMTF